MRRRGHVSHVSIHRAALARRQCYLPANVGGLSLADYTATRYTNYAATAYAIRPNLPHRPPLSDERREEIA